MHGIRDPEETVVWWRLLGSLEARVEKHAHDQALGEEEVLPKGAEPPPGVTFRDKTGRK